MSLKFCANLSFMYQETSNLVERYSLAKNSGFAGVECANPYDHTIDELVEAKSDLEQVLINVPNGNLNNGELGFAAIPGKESNFKESLEKAVLYAKGLSCKLVHITSGVVKFPTLLHNNCYELNLREAASILEKNDLIGVIEPINNNSVPGYYMNNFESAESLLKKINSPNLKLQLDLFHLQIIKGDLTRNIKNLFPLISHIQIAQIPNRNEPDTPGEVNYDYIFDTLKELGYSGWIGLEYKPLNTTDQGLDWIKKYGFALK